MGAARRDFPNFNVYFRRNVAYRVVAFTATQIPGIEERICDSVVLGTPMNLDELLKLDRPTTRARFELQEIGSPNLEEILAHTSVLLLEGFVSSNS